MTRRVMIITGGSRGIGAATALLASRNGYDVCVNYERNGPAADEVVAACQAEGASACALQADVSDEGAVIDLFDRTEAELGPIEVLINNAGVVAQISRFDAYEIDRIRRTFDINVVGAFIVAREAVRRMSTTNGGIGGSIVNVSSAASYLGSPNEFIDYAASKGAIDSLTIGLAKEVATEGIRVNAVRPGLIETEIHAAAGAPDRVERLAPGIPMQRGGSPDEVAEAILWLAGDAASYVTGSLLNVAGGR
jgi:NAD(P)-dependent dehydrogenase (short-subunit alcohol dehydrogenase family)